MDTTAHSPRTKGNQRVFKLEKGWGVGVCVYTQIPPLSPLTPRTFSIQRPQPTAHPFLAVSLGFKGFSAPAARPQPPQPCVAVSARRSTACRPRNNRSIQPRILLLPRTVAVFPCACFWRSTSVPLLGSTMVARSVLGGLVARLENRRESWAGEQQSSATDAGGGARCEIIVALAAAGLRRGNELAPQWAVFRAAGAAPFAKRSRSRYLPSPPRLVMLGSAES